jgi:hypothetical protein
MVEAAGVEPEKRRFPNQLTAYELWSQVVVVPSLATTDPVRNSPRDTPKNLPIRGEIVEAAGTINRRSFCRLAAGSVLCASKTKENPRLLHLFSMSTGNGFRRERCLCGKDHASAIGVTKSSLMRNAADDPDSTRQSRMNSTASRIRASRLSPSGRP